MWGEVGVRGERGKGGYLKDGWRKGGGGGWKGGGYGRDGMRKVNGKV